MAVSRTSWIIVASLLAVVLAYMVRSHRPFGLPSPITPLKTAIVKIGDRQFRVEIATTPAQHQRGLQKRTTLDPDAGMLFILKRQEVAEFWMKDTLIPLDMIFLDANGRVVKTHLAVPPCRIDPCPGYSSERPVQYVLELAAGHGADLKPGDLVEMPASLR